VIGVSERVSASLCKPVRINTVGKMNHFLVRKSLLGLALLFLPHAHNGCGIVENTTRAHPPSKDLSPLKSALGGGCPCTGLLIRHVKDTAMQGNHIRDFALYGYVPSDTAQAFGSVQMNKIQARIFAKCPHQCEREEVSTFAV
jgi:hypothetical protein